MKKLILILVLLTTYAYSQTKVSDMDSITTMVTTDLFWINKDIGSSTFAHRQLSWTNLRNQMIDYIDGLANTWALKQTYSSGATFSAGANGKASFADSVYCSSFVNVGIGLPLSPGTGFWGISTQPFYQMTALNFIVPNSEGNDSCAISYDDSTLSFSKAVSFSGLTITESVGVDSGAAFTGMIWSNVEYTVSTAADSIITLTTYAPSVELVLPADVNSPGISRIHVNEATKGQIIRLWNPGLAYVIAFTQSVGDDDNLVMAGNDTLAYADNITFQYIGLSGGKQIWMEVNRSDNVQ